jgi:hypothetical protein
MVDGVPFILSHTLYSGGTISTLQYNALKPSSGRKMPIRPHIEVENPKSLKNISQIFKTGKMETWL